jgi:hypothetical protein
VQHLHRCWHNFLAKIILNRNCKKYLIMAILPHPEQFQKQPGVAVPDEQRPISTDELEALLPTNDRDVLLERVFTPNEVDLITSEDVSQREKARLVSCKFHEFPILKDFLDQYSINLDAPYNDPGSPLQRPDELVIAGATYAIAEQHVMDRLEDPEFFWYLGNADVKQLSEAKESADIASQVKMIDVLTADFALSQRRYGQLRTTPGLMDWIREQDPRTASDLDTVSSHNLRDRLIALETQSTDYGAHTRKLQREAEEQAAAAAKAAEEQAAAATKAAEEQTKQHQREVETTDTLLDLLTERGGALNAYLLSRKKNPIDTYQLIEEKTATEALAILETEYSGPGFAKYLKKLSNPLEPRDIAVSGNKDPGSINVPLGTTRIPRLRTHRQIDEVVWP